MDLTGLAAAAFLDAQGRFAKDEDTVATVRLYFVDSPAEYHEDLTAEEFDALTPAERETIRNSGSGAGRIVTAGKSNA